MFLDFEESVILEESSQFSLQVLSISDEFEDFQ